MVIAWWRCSGYLLPLRLASAPPPGRGRRRGRRCRASPSRAARMTACRRRRKRTGSPDNMPVSGGSSGTPGLKPTKNPARRARRGLGRAAKLGLSETAYAAARWSQAARSLCLQQRVASPVGSSVMRHRLGRSARTAESPSRAHPSGHRRSHPYVTHPSRSNHLRIQNGSPRRTGPCPPSSHRVEELGRLDGERSGLYCASRERQEVIYGV